MGTSQGPGFGRGHFFWLLYASQTQVFASNEIPPPLKPMEETLAAYNLEIAALRGEGLTRGLSIAGAEHLFTLGFALEQMLRDCADLERCVQELARPSPLDRAGEG